MFDANAWGHSKIDSFAEIPDGKYFAHISDIALDLSSVPSRLKFEYTLVRALDASLEINVSRRKVWQTRIIKPENYGRIKADFLCLELAVDDIDSAEAMHERLMDRINNLVLITVKKNKDSSDPSKVYTNAFLSRRATDEELTEVEFQGAQEPPVQNLSQDTIPF
jgi:hypothetical protein